MIYFRYFRRISILMVLVIILGCCAGCGRKKEVKTATETDAKDSIYKTKYSDKNDYVETIEDNVNIYIDPDEKSKVYITLNKGVDLTRTGMNSEWTEILLNGGYYYVRSDKVKKTSVKWATENEADENDYTIFIDPAKQMMSNNELEPSKPDGSAMKPKMGDSEMGVTSGNFEYQVSMLVASALKDELTKRGYTVILSRTSNNVDISNAERAAAANEANADIYIRIAAPSSSDPTVHGILGFINSSENAFTKEHYQDSYRLCHDIINGVCRGDEDRNRGIYESDDITALNYCTMPATVINIGFLSNIDEDANLSYQNYREVLAEGMANGIDLYFQEAK